MPVPNIPEKELEFDKTLVVSTAHISKKDDIILCNSVVQSVSVDAYEYGYRVHVPAYDEEGFQEVIDECRRETLSEEFCTLMQLARKHNCNWLRLDCDGTQYEQLKTFDW